MRLRSGEDPDRGNAEEPERDRQRAHLGRRQRIWATVQPLRRVGNDGRRLYVALAKFLAKFLARSRHRLTDSYRRR